jgi:hypothetical protein
MMGHPDFARLSAFEDGEVHGARRDRTARHLAACARCRAELASIRALRARAAAATVLPVPPDALERILARRAAGERIIPPAAAGLAAAPARVSPRVLRRAAILLLGVAGIASATVAAPRIRAWLTDGETADPAPPPAVDSVRAGAAPAQPQAVSGVSILPAEGRARVDVDGADPALRIRVRLVAGEELEARATGAAADAVFHPRPGRLRVQHAGPGELELLLPRGVGRVDVRVDGEPYLVKDGSQLRVLRPGADTAGSEVLLRVGGAAP